MLHVWCVVCWCICCQHICSVVFSTVAWCKFVHMYAACVLCCLLGAFCAFTCSSCHPNNRQQAHTISNNDVDRLKDWAVVLIALMSQLKSDDAEEWVAPTLMDRILDNIRQYYRFFHNIVSAGRTMQIWFSIGFSSALRDVEHIMFNCQFTKEWNF